MSTILKIKKLDNYFVSDNAHYHGGIDVKQNYLFNHLFPTGLCHESEIDLLLALADAHGWTVEF